MHLVKRFAVTIVGVVLLAIGVALMVLPGPGILLIVAGLAVLATEYVWARTLLVRAKRKAQEVQEAAVASRMRTAGSVLFAVGMCVVGVLMLIIEDVRWPVLDDVLSSVWGPVTGGVLVVTGVILVTTTVLTVRLARGEQTTYVQPSHTSGATLHRPAR